MKAIGINNFYFKCLIKKRKNINNITKERTFQDVVSEYISVRELEKKKTEMLKNKATLSKFYPNKTMNYVSPSVKTCIYSNENLKLLREQKYIEAFSTRYQNKTLDIRITKTNFHESDALMVIVSDKTELIRLKVLEDIDEFKNNTFASFSHELRTPLNCIFCFLNVLEREENISDEMKKNFIKPMWCSAKILLNMVDNILDYSKITTKKLGLDIQEFNLKSLVERTVDLIRIQAEHKGLTVGIDFQSDKFLQKNLPEKFSSDSSKIEQILIQLLLNALKFTMEGSIKVKVECVPYLQDAIQISVIDTGIGMTEGVKNSLDTMLRGFSIHQTNFQRVTNHSSGGSLGLSVSHILALKLGYKKNGGIFFESEENAGSKFSFIIKNKERQQDRSPKNKGSIIKKSGSGSITSRQWNRVYSLNVRKDYIPEQRKKGISFTKVKKNQMSQSAVVSKQKDGKDTDLASAEDDVLLRNSAIWEMIPKINSHKFIENSFRNIQTGLNSGHYDQLQNSSRDLSKLTTEMKPLIQLHCCDHPKVLIVDDDNFNILGLGNLLKSRGVTSMSANNGQSAIELILKEIIKRESCCLQFKLIFMDINMPIMDGLEATSKIRELIQSSTIPSVSIVALTSYIDQEDKINCLNHGMDDYVTKPMDIYKLNVILYKYRVLEYRND